MSAVTFIYKIGTSGFYIGKCVFEYLSDDQTELDLYIHSHVLSSINNYRNKKGYRPLKNHELKIGILSQV